MSLAQSYARALFEMVQESSLKKPDLNQVIHELEQFQNGLDDSPIGQKVFLNSVIQAKEKIALISSCSEKLKFLDVTSHFLQIICRKNRVSSLKKIIQSLKFIQLSEQGGVEGRVVSSHPLSEEDLEILVQTFSKKLGKKVTLQVSTDTSLLAGIQVTLNGVTYDGTLRSQLQQLRESLIVSLAQA